MIDFIKQVPTIYSQESRDFQVLTKLYDALFNACKFYSDSILGIHRNKFESVADLKCANSNFFPQRDWDNLILDAISQGFNYLVKNKGTREAIESCINILLRLFEIPQNHKALIISSESFLNKNYNEEMLLETNSIVIIIPKDLVQIGIVQDLMKYLLPVGVSCRVVEIEIIDRAFITQLTYENNIKEIKLGDEKFNIPLDSAVDSMKNRNYYYRKLLTDNVDNLSASAEESFEEIPMPQIKFNKVIKDKGESNE